MCGASTRKTKRCNSGVVEPEAGLRATVGSSYAQLPALGAAFVDQMGIEEKVWWGTG
jgi:hypothetical protein